MIVLRIFEFGIIVFVFFEVNGFVFIFVVKRVDVGFLNDVLKVFFCKLWMVEVRICIMW